MVASSLVVFLSLTPVVCTLNTGVGYIYAFLDFSTLCVESSKQLLPPPCSLHEREDMAEADRRPSPSANSPSQPSARETLDRANPTNYRHHHLPAVDVTVAILQ